MAHHSKIMHPAAYHTAIERLDAALEKSLRSQAEDIGDIHRLRRAVFGCLPEDGRQERARTSKNESSPTQSDPIRPLKA